MDQLMCRQVDAMLLAMKTEGEYYEFNKEISKTINMDPENKLATSFNGIEIEQTQGYIAIRVEKYIDKVNQNHGWEKETCSKKPKAPLNNTLAREILDSGKGATAKAPEAVALEKEMGFPYRMLLGELIFACVVVRLDIGYAMSLLSRFAEYPAKVHYLGLKSVWTTMRYLAWSGLPSASIFILDMAMDGNALPVSGRSSLYSASETIVYSHQVWVSSWRPRYSSRYD